MAVAGGSAAGIYPGMCAGAAADSRAGAGGSSMGCSGGRSGTDDRRGGCRDLPGMQESTGRRELPPKDLGASVPVAQAMAAAAGSMERGHWSAWSNAGERNVQVRGAH